MSSYVFVVMIVAIGCATAVVSQYLKSREQRREQGEDVSETLTQLEALEERIKVLERIVTESRVDLKREIDKL